MSILCGIFGHKAFDKNSYHGAEYGRVREAGTDGIGRVHMVLLCKCPRCDEEYIVGRFHMPQKFLFGKGTGP